MPVGTSVYGGSRGSKVNCLPRLDRNEFIFTAAVSLGRTYCRLSVLTHLGSVGRIYIVDLGIIFCLSNLQNSESVTHWGISFLSRTLTKNRCRSMTADRFTCSVNMPLNQCQQTNTSITQLVELSKSHEHGAYVLKSPGRLPNQRMQSEVEIDLMTRCQDPRPA